MKWINIKDKLPDNNTMVFLIYKLLSNPHLTHKETGYVGTEELLLYNNVKFSELLECYWLDESEQD